jgi:hypothetical protein
LVDQTFFQWLTGNEVKASSFSALLRNMISSLGNWRPSMSAITSSCSRTWWASGWAKIVRMAAATISAEPLGTLEDIAQEVCQMRPPRQLALRGSLDPTPADQCRRR